MRGSSILFSLLALATLLLAACSDVVTDAPETRADLPGERRTINFGIIATESTSTRETNWRPFIETMSEWTGYDVPQ